MGLLSDLSSKNCWTITEWTRDATPRGMQHPHLLVRATWDAGGVRDDLGDYVAEYQHDDQAVLVIHETGESDEGQRTVGVHRQYALQPLSGGGPDDCRMGAGRPGFQAGRMTHRARHKEP